MLSPQRYRLERLSLDAPMMQSRQAMMKVLVTQNLALKQKTPT
jgi:hypothetical protein